MATLVTAPWWPWFSELFNQSAWVWMNGMMAASRWAAELPGGHWYVAAPPWPWWIPYVIGSVLLVRWPLAGRKWRRCVGAGVALCLGGAVGAWAWSRAEARIVVSAGGEIYWCESAAGSLLVNCGAAIRIYHFTYSTPKLMTQASILYSPAPTHCGTSK